MKRLIVGLMFFTISFSSFADSSSLCEMFKKQIDERAAAVIQTEKIIDDTQAETQKVSEDLILLEKKYKRRKAIWIPVATVAGIGTIALGFTSLKALFSNPNTGSLGGNIAIGLLDRLGGLLGISGTILLGTGTYVALKPISMTKQQMAATQEALEMLIGALSEYKGALGQLEEQVAELKASYVENCE